MKINVLFIFPKCISIFFLTVKMRQRERERSPLYAFFSIYIKERSVVIQTAKKCLGWRHEWEEKREQQVFLFAFKITVNMATYLFRVVILTWIAMDN